jgi:hypothetical protein
MEWILIVLSMLVVDGGPALVIHPAARFDTAVECEALADDMNLIVEAGFDVDDLALLGAYCQPRGWI